MHEIFFHINGDDSVRQIQNRFHRLFPRLVIKFFKNLTGTSICDNRSIPFSSEVKMKDINHHFREGVAEFEGYQTIRKTEEELYSRFGLSVQLSVSPPERIQNISLSTLEHFSSDTRQPAFDSDLWADLTLLNGVRH